MEVLYEQLLSCNYLGFATEEIFFTAVSLGRSQDKAACPLCHTQEGDPHGGTCVQSSSSGSIAPGDPKAPDRCSSICAQCQSSLAEKRCGDQSPPSLPQCPRHMKQVQLLFCEDHREPICLICRLSQEHQGHRVRPIEEAALEYKVGAPSHIAGHLGLCSSSKSSGVGVH